MMETSRRTMKDLDFRDFIEKVREKTDIVQVIGSYIPLNRQNKALCPFHQEKVPSFSVNPQGQYFYCFGCGVGGDVFKFLELYLRKPFIEVLSELAQQAGILFPTLTSQQKTQIKEDRQIQHILTETARFYHHSLTPEVRIYLTKGRGLTKDTIDLNRIGYAPIRKDAHFRDSGLLKFLKEQDYTKSQAVEAGVLYNNGREYFSGYIVFPHWYYGKVIYITGRGYPHKSHRKLRKKKLPLNHLFFEQALREKKVIITEGEIDTYTLRQAGFNACGILGTGAFKAEWLGRFKNVEIVHLSLDGDEGGTKASLKLGDQLKDKARIVPFPDFTRPDGKKVKDWNELFTTKHWGDVHSFRQEYQQLLQDAQTILEFKIRQITRDISKREIPKVLSPIIAQLADLSEVEQEFYIDVITEHLKDTLSISRQAIKRDVKQLQKGIPERGEDNIEVLDDTYPKISPALDFVNGVGYLSVPLDVKLTTQIKGVPVTKIATVPFLVTSNREFFRIDKVELLQKKGLILKSQPLFLDSSRWSLKHIRQFRSENFRADPFLLFQEVKTIYDSYLDFKESHTAEVITVWTIGTYLYLIFETYPYISFTGERGSGKTKTLNVAERFCFNAVCSSDISPSLLFRIIEGSSCTVLIDEAERLKDPRLSQDLRLLLNAGYKRGGRAHRSRPETFEPQSFEVYSPKMIANIKGLEEVLENRCIQFTMLRTKDIEKANRVVTETGEDWAYIRHLLYAFGLTSFQEIQHIYLNDTETKSLRAISGREGELWHPLLATAKFLDEKGCDGLFEMIKEVALKKGEEARSTGIDEWTNALLLGLRELTSFNEIDISNKEIKEKMAAYLEDGDSAPSYHWIGRTLKRLGLVEEGERTKRGYRYIIRYETVQDVIERYGI